MWRMERMQIRMPDLADFLADKVRQSSYRAVAAHTGVSRGALENLVRRLNTEPPELPTLEKISKSYNLPLWKVMELAGYDLGLPNDANAIIARFVALADRYPNLRPLLNDLIDLPDDRQRQALAYMQTLIRYYDEHPDSALGSPPA